jgi:hypothetical protein
MNVILKSLKDYQEKYDVFLWDMVIHDKLIHIAFHPSFGYIIGDNEGHDKTCGKFLNRMNVQRLCRYCNTPLECSDDPFYNQWKFTKASTISKMVKDGRSDDLKEMSYHSIENAMTAIKFADPNRGINGATPAERLHLLNHGLFQMILEYNFGQKRAKATSKNLRSLLKFRPPDIANDNEEECDNPDNDELSDDECSESSDEGDDELQSNAVNSSDSTHESAQPVLSHVALFTPTVCDQFDSDAKEYGRILQKQSS